MPTTVLKLKVKTVKEVYIRRENPSSPKKYVLGDRLIFTEDITAINGNTSLKGRHLGFAVLVREPDIWLSQAGWILPKIPGTPFKKGGQIEARVVTQFTAPKILVAITGGTGDFRQASGEIEIGDPYVATIFTP